ncbi:hypothetical protein Syun_016767 [Stephania yunnanensis]|uniref:Yippee domain-containing protein n=1 Tax=Stephania yunnanensis TaxID=152371 RepID=A0AAP0J6M5_9MAGN
MSVSMDIDKGRGGGTDVALEGLEGPIYKCKHCQAPLALSQHVVSKSFLCKEGKGYLFSKVVNVSLGEKEERTLLTGVYTVADVSCISCGSIIGWKYEIVQEEKDKYKEGKFILERLDVQVLKFVMFDACFLGIDFVDMDQPGSQESRIRSGRSFQPPRKISNTSTRPSKLLQQRADVATNKRGQGKGRCSREASHEDSAEYPKTSRRKLSHAEDVALVNAMVEMVASSVYKCDNGFKPGYFSHLEEALKITCPNSRIKARPPDSALTRLPTWSPLPMMYGKITLGATGEDTRAPKDAFEDINNVHDSSSTNEPLTAPTEEFDAIPTSSRTRTTTADGSGNQAKKKRKTNICCEDVALAYIDGRRPMTCSLLGDLGGAQLVTEEPGPTEFKVLGPAENDSDDEAKDGLHSAALLSRIIDMFQKHAKEVQKTLDANKEWMEKLESKVSDLTSEVHQLRSELQECKSTQNAVAPGHV